MREPATYIRNTENLYKKLGYKPYDWFQADSPPAFTLPAKLLKESRLGLISTSGAYVAGQVAYHYKDDTSIRSIPADTEQANLRFSHIMENYLIEARQDPQCVLPLRALQKLKEEESVKGLAQNYYSCMGGIYSQRRVREELIPSLQQALSSEEIDLLILIPL